MAADGTVPKIQLPRQPDRCSIVLDDNGIITLRSLSRLTSEFRQTLDASKEDLLGLGH